MDSNHIDLALVKIRNIFEKASKKIEEMKPGEKVTATGLAQKLAEEFEMTGPTLYPTLKFLLEVYPGISITKGAKGGITKLAVK